MQGCRKRIAHDKIAFGGSARASTTDAEDQSNSSRGSKGPAILLAQYYGSLTILRAHYQFSGSELTKLIGNKIGDAAAVHRISVHPALEVPDAIRQRVWELYSSNMENPCVC